MNRFANDDGRALVTAMVEAIHSNSAFLSELDGVIGDGDHGINMNKGFTQAAQKLQDTSWDLTTGLEVLSSILLDEIGGAMGPLYGTFFAELARVSDHRPVDAPTLGAMLRAGKDAVQALGKAQIGDKTLIDTLAPACEAFDAAVARGADFASALDELARAAEQGKDSTKELVAKVGRSSRLGERSRGLLDAGSVSCWLLLRAIAQSSKRLLTDRNLPPSKSLRFERRSLYAFNMPYALGTLELGGRPCVVAATEDRGPIVISAPPYESARILADGPGGCMSLVPHPGAAGELFAIMGCFLGYNFHGGALYRVTASGLGAPGQVQKVVDLPFAHRMEVVDRDGAPTLVIANLASVKDSPQDWSRPGSVYSLTLPGGAKPGLQLLKPGIHKNHGFLKTTFLGRPSLLISGVEGVFSLDVGPGVPWEFRPVLGHEVSEIAVADLDGDGVDELITIEPFHGNRLVIYKHTPPGWSPVWETALDYGHCVLADTILGRPSLLVSNRAGDKDLLLFQFPSSDTFTRPERIVIDSGVGAANMLVVHHGQQELIFATNQSQGELVRYQVKG